MKTVTFDIEIAEIIPDGAADWKAFRPLGITCAATLTSGGHMIKWHGDLSEGGYAERMTPQQCCEMASYLMDLQRQRYRIVTWNGLGFDFDVLAEETQDARMNIDLSALALEHIDIAFTMLCDLGYMVGLDTAAKGMGLPGKTEGMHGDLAPVMWKQGIEAQAKVLEYVGQDVISTLEVCQAIEKVGWLNWTSRSGRRQRWVLPRGTLLTVKESLELPLPDTSWMTDPRRREDCYVWTGLDSSLCELSTEVSQAA